MAQQSGLGLIITFGPEMPGWGSWEWVGSDIQQELSKVFKPVPFTDSQPEANILLQIKFPATFEWMEELRDGVKVIYCPIDFYGSAAEIDADGLILRKCSRILVHCERLRKYFDAYASVEYMDHHVKFAAPMRESFRSKGYILWIGVRTNLPSLVEWINEHPLPAELRILTNPETPGVVPAPVEFGFRPDRNVHIAEWSKERHIQWTAEARAALDIKGQDFRSRHKPPAKAIDFIASGVPLAMNLDSSPVEHLARMGFDVASPLDTDRWFSRDYWEETQRFGRALRELLSLERIGRRYKKIIESVLQR